MESVDVELPELIEGAVRTPSVSRCSPAMRTSRPRKFFTGPIEFLGLVIPINHA